MNERISAFLVRLGADPALRARFEQNPAAVMAAEGLSAAEQAEVLQRMNEPTSRGRIFAASFEDPLPEQDVEGRIHAPEEEVEGRIHVPDDDPEGRIHVPSEPEVPADSPDDAAQDDSASATSSTA